MDNDFLNLSALNDALLKAQEHERADREHWSSMLIMSEFMGDWQLQTNITSGTRLEILEWCQLNLAPGTYRCPGRSIKFNDWLILKGENLSKFLLRWL